MLKKIALVMLLALPMGVFAQNLKFGHINAQEIITVMPEFTKENAGRIQQEISGIPASYR